MFKPKNPLTANTRFSVKIDEKNFKRKRERQTEKIERETEKIETERHRQRKKDGK